MSVQVTIPGGNVGQEIREFTFGQGGKGIGFDVAYTDKVRGEEVTRWYKIACFGKVQQQAEQWIQEGKLVKGAKVLVMGAFQPRDYTTRNGEERISFDVVANYLDVIQYPKPQQQEYTSQDQDYGYDDPEEYPGF